MQEETIMVVGLPTTTTTLLLVGRVKVVAKGMGGDRLDSFGGIFLFVLPLVKRAMMNGGADNLPE